MSDNQPDRADRFGPQDLIVEALTGVAARPGRLVLTVLGTVLGIASVVTTSGLASTAAGQIDQQFNAVAATQVIIAPAKTTSADAAVSSAIPWDAEARVAPLAGVVAAGTESPVALGDIRVSSVQVTDPSASTPAPLPVVAVSPGYISAAGGSLASGRYFDFGHDERADRVVVLGPVAASALRVKSVDVQPAIFIGDQPYTVIGVLDALADRADLSDAVFLPQSTARADFGVDSIAELRISIEIGAGAVVGAQAPIALDPVSPEGFSVQVPPSMTGVRDGVKSQMSSVFLALGGVALLVGGLGIANVTLLSVIERSGEIGLRRALGARRRDIAAQFLAESGVVGLLGGLLGAALGVTVVVLVSVVRQWTPILDTGFVVITALAGGVIGLASGIYPALRAAATEPIAALRTGP